jgi:prolyl-tRNA synthetase
VKTAWCGDEACEEVIKEKVAAEITMLPLEDGGVPEADVEGGEAVDVDGDDCTMCGEPASEVAYFAKTY